MKEHIRVPGNRPKMRLKSVEWDDDGRQIDDMTTMLDRLGPPREEVPFEGRRHSTISDSCTEAENRIENKRHTVRTSLPSAIILLTIITQLTVSGGYNPLSERV